MWQFRTPVLVQQQQNIVKIAVSTLIGFSLGLGYHAERVNAQTPLSVAQVQRSQSKAVLLNRSRVCPNDLQSAIASILRRPRFKTARWGILIQPIAQPGVLYQHNPELSLIPASNVKLLTTAAALRSANTRALQTRPIFQNWVIDVNRNSNNAKADALLRRVGGQVAIKSSLAALGVPFDGYAQVDGSGLSRRNRATPATLVSLLKGMYTDQRSQLFYKSLAVAGVNGTLRHRFLNTPVQGRLHGKTGTLRGVRALSGYLETRDYGTIAFSIVVNQPGQSGQILTQAIDQIVLQTAQVTRC
jgi:serine-type D-Ala-D-Ala carboxypeptidase/endopeptidase (penicillin-binding protein 4)